MEDKWESKKFEPKPKKDRKSVSVISGDLDNKLLNVNIFSSIRHLGLIWLCLSIFGSIGMLIIFNDTCLHPSQYGCIRKGVPATGYAWAMSILFQGILVAYFLFWLSRVGLLLTGIYYKLHK